MFGNYLATALRNIVRHKLYSVINIVGLAVGLACVIFIILFIRDEASYDRWMPDGANLYRLDQTLTLPGRPVLDFAVTSFPLAALMKDHLPEVTAMTRFWPQSKTLTVGDRSFAQDLSEVDTDFFKIIRFALVAGDPATVLAQPESIVLSQTLARKLFGDEDPVGKTLAVNKTGCGSDTISCPNEKELLRVTGIMRDLPHNSHMRVEAVIPHVSPADSLGKEGKAAWFNMNGYSYVRLVPGSDPNVVQHKLRALLDQHVDILEGLGVKTSASKVMQVRLVPFTAVHLNGEGEIGNQVPPASRTLLYSLGAIGFLILLVACFNFTNLATARALMRAREIALRKCAGARRSQLIAQFLGEAVLMALLALGLSLSLVEMALPACSAFLGRPIGLNYIADWPLVASIVTISIVCGLISGAYPALVLSRFRPAWVLRANVSGRGGSSALRSILVVLQFTVAIGLAIVTLVVFAQVDYARNQSLGFRHDNILVINTFRRMTAAARDSFVEQLRRSPGVLDIARSSDVPFSGSSSIAPMRVPGQQEALTMEKFVGTPETFRLYGMTLLAGRLLSDARGEDRASPMAIPENSGRSILINQAAATRFGFMPAEAVGKTVLFGRGAVRIVGVLADARIDGARDPARPTIFLNSRDAGSFLSIRIAGGRVPEVVRLVDHAWRQFAPNVAIERFFLDDSFEKLYRSDEKQGAMFGVFVGIAIAIACLGLFGLVAFTVGRRTREIGIRKVFGARTRDVTLLLLWQFSRPVLVANLIAWPAAWYYLHHWLQGFAYRVPLNPLYFAGVGLTALLIAWATIFAHAYRVARANPINALRYE